ncbi:MAG: DegT/DnrJ/EryC1/StrS family aminotransferase [Fervidobacterium sp.]|nr:DegT/DnrJ/EryC1/StrS family aminotransferase [Fervidobacterium sp.]
MIKLSAPDVGEEELAEIKKVLESGWLIQGDKVYEFENMVKRYLNVKHVLAVSNGTAALHLALLALGISQGDEVIVPDFTFPATANVVEMIGAKCQFVDVDISTFNIDPEKITNKITEKTKAIIVVHEFGCPARMDKIMDIADKYNLKVIEDAACALGSDFNGKKVGTIGHVGCFSLHPRKNITTGEGGLVATNDEKVAEKVSLLRNHGIKIRDGKVTFEIAGLNYRLTNIQGAIGIVQMKKLESIIQKRRLLAEIYTNFLKEIPWIKLPYEPLYGTHIWQTYHVLLDERINRNSLIEYLRANGIESNYGAYAVHREPYYKRKYDLQDYNYQNSIVSADRGLALPMHSKLDYEDIAYIARTLEKYKV